MRRRRIALAALAIASLVVLAGTSSFTATSADRGVNVRVADDDNAYLAIPDETLKCGSPAENEIFENNLGTTLERAEITVRVPVGTNSMRIGKGREGNRQTNLIRVDPGESRTLTFDSSYWNIDEPILHVAPVNGTTPETVPITVEATAPGVSVVLEDRDFWIDCARPAETETDTETETETKTEADTETETGASEE